MGFKESDEESTPLWYDEENDESLKGSATRAKCFEWEAENGWTLKDIKRPKCNGGLHTCVYEGECFEKPKYKKRG